MKRFILLLFTLILSITLFAQLEVKDGSFKEVPGFVNINTEKMYDDNDKPYAVLKIRTENINNKQRRELNFGGDARTFYEAEYHDGEVWLYISYYATFIKISHPDLSSVEFWLPFDMEPKKGYELTLINKPSVDEDILKRLERLENAAIQKSDNKNQENYVSEHKDDKFISNGVLNYSNGSTYEGTYVDGKPHGKGKIKWVSGDVYDGEWVNGIIQGKGKIIFANGDVYEGEFKNAELHGNGIYRYSNGDVYEGEFKNGERTGNGTYTKAEVNVEKGSWIDGIFDAGIWVYLAIAAIIFLIIAVIKIFA